MNYMQRRRLKKHIESVNFEFFKRQHGETGEYRALCWLKAYIEGRAAAEPLQLVKSIIDHSPNGIDADTRLYLVTLLEWI